MVFDALDFLCYKRLDVSSFELCSLEDTYARKAMETAYKNGMTMYEASYASPAVLKTLTYIR